MEKMFRNDHLLKMRIILILLFSSIHLCQGQNDLRSILEVFNKNNGIELYDYECLFEMDGKSVNIQVDSSQFFEFPFSDYLDKEITIKVKWEGISFYVEGLKPNSLIDKHIEIELNENSPDSCVQTSYYWGCTVIPAKIEEECPESHELVIFSIPIISNKLYEEADSLANELGIPLEKYWFDGIKFKDKEAYLGWIEKSRKQKYKK